MSIKTYVNRIRSAKKQAKLNRELHVAVKEAIFSGLATGDRVSEVLQAGADPNAKDEHGHTPLWVTAYHSRIKLTRLLIHHGADASAPSANGRTPLATAVFNYSDKRSVKIASMLINAGATPDEPERKTLVALFKEKVNMSSAARITRRSLMGCLLNAGLAPDLLSDTSKQQTLLHLIASYRGVPEDMEFLATRGADVNARDTEGDTPLHMAAHYGETVSVRALLGLGVDINAVNHAGDTPLCDAIKCDQTTRAQVLEIIGMLLESGATPGDAELRALGQMYDNRIVTQRRDMLICLLDAGLGDDRVWDEATGRTLLHSMCANGTVPAGDIEVLLARGGSVNVTDNNGNTPLHLYMGRRPSKAVSLAGLKTLIEHDADVHAVNGDGQTPYHLAKAQGLSDACDMLSNYGGDVERAAALAGLAPATP